MKLSPKVVIYAAAALALVIGVVAYSGMEDQHEETGLLEGDLVKVVVLGAVLAVIAVISLVYLAKKPPEEM